MKGTAGPIEEGGVVERVRRGRKVHVLSWNGGFVWLTILEEESVQPGEWGMLDVTQRAGGSVNQGSFLFEVILSSVCPLSL